MGDDEIRLPVDLPGYDDSIQQLNKIIESILKVQATKDKLIKTDKELADAYGRGEGSWKKRRKQADEYYKSLTAINAELDRMNKAGKTWASYISGWNDFKKTMRGESEKQRLHSMSWRLEGTGGLGLSFKGLKEKTKKVIPDYPRWGGIPKKEAAIMRGLAGAASGGFYDLDFNKGMSKATKRQKEHGDAAGRTNRILGIEARTFKWMLGFALMGTNAIKKLTSESKIFNSLWGLIGKAFGFILDMIILPLAPFIMWIAEGMFAVGEGIYKVMSGAMEANPWLAGLLSIMTLLTGAAIAVGLVKLVAGFFGIEGAAYAATKAAALLGISLKLLAAAAVIGVVLYLLDQTGLSDWISKTQWKFVNLSLGIATVFKEALLTVADFFYEALLNKIDAFFSKIQQSPFGFLFPGIGNARAGVEYLKSQIPTGEERWATAFTNNPYFNALGLTNSLNPFTQNANMNARWRELYPDPYTFYGNALGEQLVGWRNAGPGWVGAGQGAPGPINNLTVNTMNIGIDPTDFNDLYEEASRRAWDSQNRSVIGYR